MVVLRSPNRPNSLLCGTTCDLSLDDRRAAPKSPSGTGDDWDPVREMDMLKRHTRP